VCDVFTGAERLTDGLGQSGGAEHAAEGRPECLTDW